METVTLCLDVPGTNIIFVGIEPYIKAMQRKPAPDYDVPLPPVARRKPTSRKPKPKPTVIPDRYSLNDLRRTEIKQQFPNVSLPDPERERIRKERLQQQLDARKKW